MLATTTTTFILNELRRKPNDDLWRQFCERYEPVLHGVVRRAGLRQQDAADVVQEAMMAFFRGLRDGQYDPQRGSVRSWLHGILLNRIREARRRLARPEVQPKDADYATAFLDRIPDDRALNDMFDEEWRRGLVTACVREVRRQVDDRTFRAFDLYARQGWPAEKVAEHLGISRNAVYISKTRVLSRLRAIKAKLSADW